MISNIIKFLIINILFTLICGGVIWLINDVYPVWIRVWFGSFIISGIFFTLLKKYL
jgi:hypothetical protein